MEPFVFRLPIEKLEEFVAFTPEMKLDWLEDAADFIVNFVGIEKWENWKNFLNDPPRDKQ